MSHFSGRPQTGSPSAASFSRYLWSIHPVPGLVPTVNKKQSPPRVWSFLAKETNTVQCVWIPYLQSHPLAAIYRQPRSQYSECFLGHRTTRITCIFSRRLLVGVPSRNTSFLQGIQCHVLCIFVLFLLVVLLLKTAPKNYAVQSS